MTIKETSMTGSEVWGESRPYMGRIFWDEDPVTFAEGIQRAQDSNPLQNFGVVIYSRSDNFLNNLGDPRLTRSLLAGLADDENSLYQSPEIACQILEGQGLGDMAKKVRAAVKAGGYAISNEPTRVWIKYLETNKKK